MSARENDLFTDRSVSLHYNWSVISSQLLDDVVTILITERDFLVKSVFEQRVVVCGQRDLEGKPGNPLVYRRWFGL